MIVEAVIFDVDGTLVDTVDMHAEAWQRAFKEFGKELEFQTVREQIGKGGDQLMPEFLTKEEITDFSEKLEKRRTEIFDNEYLPKTKPFPKVRELVKRIKKDGIKIVLASSATDEEVEFFKKVMNIADLLEAETTSDDAEESKPEPDIFEAALKFVRAASEKHEVSITTSEAASFIDPKNSEKIEDDVDEAIWEEMETGLRHQGRITWNFVFLMALGGAICAVGLVSEPAPQDNRFCRRRNHRPRF